MPKFVFAFVLFFLFFLFFLFIFDKCKNVKSFTKGKDNAIKDKVLKDITALFESDENDYYKPIRKSDAFNSNYSEYESKSDRDKYLSVKKYLNKIRPYLSDMISDLKTQGEWKTGLTIATDFMSCIDSKNPKDSNETSTLCTKSNNIEIIIGNATDEITEKLFESLLQIDQGRLEESLKGSKFIFSIHQLYYKCHQVSLNCGGSYIDSPKWVKNKKATINQKNIDNKCFQYALTVAFNYQSINNNQERISKIKPFIIDQYN